MLGISSPVLSQFKKDAMNQQIPTIVSQLRSVENAICARYSDRELNEIVKSAFLRLSGFGINLNGALYIYATIFLASNCRAPEAKSPLRLIWDVLENPFMPGAERLEQASAMLLDLEFGLPEKLRNISMVATPELDV